MDDSFALTTDINGKPIPRWQARLEEMYSDGVPFGEVLSFVRFLLQERDVAAILGISDDAILADFTARGGDPEKYAAEMRKRFDGVARLARENAYLREWLRGELTISDADIDAALHLKKLLYTAVKELP